MSDFDPIDSVEFLACLSQYVSQRLRNDEGIPRRDEIETLKSGFRAGFKYGDAA